MKNKAIKILGIGAVVLFVLMALIPAIVSAAEEPKYKIVEGKCWTTPECLSYMIKYLISEGAIITGVEWADEKEEIWEITYLTFSKREIPRL